MHGGFALTFLHMQIKLTTMLFKLCNLQNAYYYQLSLALTASAVSEVAVLHRRYAGVFASIVSVCSALENGRYGNAPIRSDTSSIRPGRWLRERSLYAVGGTCIPLATNQLPRSVSFKTG